jgi:hypothetical protein
MDISGKAPTTEEGSYFRNNVWFWRPVAEWIEEKAPELYAKNPYWHSNDGGGLNAKDSLALAEQIEASIADGSMAEYAVIRLAAIATLPREECKICHGTGIRSDATGWKMRQPERVIAAHDKEEGAVDDHPRLGQTGWCNGCRGYGSTPHWASNYSFTVENMAEFATFLRGSGGFEIL